MQESIADKYIILRLIGEGSYGTVYLVQHKDLNVRYALKLLNKELSSNPEFIEQFKREAETLLRFTHDGCVQVRDFGKVESSGRYYMATDYCDGGTLKDLILRNGKLDAEYALHILSEILSVLEAAHTRGIVHRDIKPENIMIVRDYKGEDIVKVLDFGISKIFDIDSKFENNLKGFAVGTPEYMSPEQALGDEELDHRVDIYSTGILGYELITGKTPFNADTVVQILLMQITKTPTLFAQKIGIPDFVEEMILKALSKDKKDRYESAKQFKEDCDKAISHLKKIKSNSLKYKSESGIFNRLIIENDIKASDELHIQNNTGIYNKDSEEINYNKPEIVQKSISDTENKKDKCNILCLDDDETFLNILSHILEHDGYKVFTTTLSSAMHSYLFTNDIKLLVTDVQMPGISGTNVCKALKDKIPDLKIILFSNIQERELEKLAKESNADGWISKLNKPHDWLEKIQEILE